MQPEQPQPPAAPATPAAQETPEVAQRRRALEAEKRRMAQTLDDMEERFQEGDKP